MDFIISINIEKVKYNLLLKEREKSIYPKIFNMKNFNSESKIVVDLSSFINEDILDEINIQLEKFDLIRRIIIHTPKEYMQFAENLAEKLSDYTEINQIEIKIIY